MRPSCSDLVVGEREREVQRCGLQTAGTMVRLSWGSRIPVPAKHRSSVVVATGRGFEAAAQLCDMHTRNGVSPSTGDTSDLYPRLLRPADDSRASIVCDPGSRTDLRVDIADRESLSLEVIDGNCWQLPSEADMFEAPSRKDWTGDLSRGLQIRN